jgi:hypothetical protein
MNSRKLKSIIVNTKSAVLQAWYYILDRSPTDTWQQPALTFITNVLSKSTGTLSEDELDQCALFLCNLARAIYGKGLDDDLLKGRTIEQEMEYAQTLAKQNKKYQPPIKVTKQFEQRLNSTIPKQLQWGLCAVVEFSRNFDEFIERETKLKLKKSILETAVVEQIFPDNWEPDPSDTWHEVVHNNELDGWNNRKIRKALKTIGNLILIEQDIHKNTSKICKGNFFGERKNPKMYKNYRDSIFGEALFISLDCRTYYDTPWSYSFYMYRQQYSIKRLIDFFSGINECILH